MLHWGESEVEVLKKPHLFKRLSNNQKKIQATIFEPGSWNSVYNYLPTITSLPGNKEENHLTIWSTCFYQFPQASPNSINHAMRLLSFLQKSMSQCLILGAKPLKNQEGCEIYLI